VERDGRLPIFNIKPVDIHKARKEADDTIALEPSDIEVEFGEECLDEIWHSSRCQRIMVDQSMPCIKAQIEAARKYKRKLDTRYLLKYCARNPWSANGLGTLEGMAQKTCIFNVEYVLQSLHALIVLIC
jgi:hypothetical protein